MLVTKTIMKTYMCMCISTRMFCIYICDPYDSQNTFQLTLLFNKEKKKTHPWIKMPWPQSLPYPCTCISFPAQLACKNGRQNLIFHGAQSTKHVQIQYKEMLYLILYRLITPNCEKLLNPWQALIKWQVTFFRTLSSN